MKLRFVTSNAGKIQEARQRLGDLGVDVVGVKRDLEEIQADRIEDVARHKAKQLVGSVRPPFFIEDAGLHIDALRGFPGTYSNYVFRTIGCEGILRLLRKSDDKDRSAHFVAVIAYVTERGGIRLFTGRADGTIASAARGSHGFGFDPIFLQHGTKRTFAELSTAAKGKVSHRGQALDLLAAHLRRKRQAVAGKKP